MFVSGSIFAVKDNYRQYAELLKNACIDYLHIDIFQRDSHFRLDDLEMFKGDFLPLDLHLIYQGFSGNDIELINRSKAKFVNVQYEALADKDEIRRISGKVNAGFGIALTAETPLEIIDENINYISQVLVMCSLPGVSGAAFEEKNYERIRKIRDRYPTLRIWVDGGIDNRIAERVGKLKADVIVSGSYLCRDLKNIYSLAYKLKYMNEDNVKVTRNMLHLNELPIVGKSAEFPDVIMEMNRYRMGAVLVLERGELAGIITDGDVRRGIEAYGKEIFEKKAFEFMNTLPFSIDAERTMEEVFESLTRKQKRTDFIPVVEKGKLIGALDLHVGL